MAEPLRFCRRCLLEDELSLENAFADTVDLEHFLHALNPKDCVDQKLYEERLSICRSCSELMNRTCRKCGCYVDLRAAAKGAKCPAVPPKWNRA